MNAPLPSKVRTVRCQAALLADAPLALGRGSQGAGSALWGGITPVGVAVGKGRGVE